MVTRSCLILRAHRTEYELALQKADASLAEGQLNLRDLHALVSKLLETQLAPFKPTAPTTSDNSKPSSSNGELQAEVRGVPEASPEDAKDKPTTDE
jgi:hypothetical protein